MEPNDQDSMLIDCNWQYEHKFFGSLDNSSFSCQLPFAIKHAKVLLHGLKIYYRCINADSWPPQISAL